MCTYVETCNSTSFYFYKLPVKIKRCEAGNGKARNWMGTMNGIDESFDGEGYLRSLVEIGLVKFAAGQLERGESGNIHLQYYIQRERQTTFATIKRQICDRSHWGSG